jgi:trimeric autotransporter adhesin
MKKLLTAILFTTINFFVFAQSPQGINYQGVAYDNTGNTIANQLVGIRFKILQGSATGQVLYEERQRPSTDNTGLFAVVIGNGTVLSGSFSSINWGSGTKWLQTGIDIAGGNNYIVMGCSQFWSVPYAFYADNATHSQYADSSLYSTNAGHANNATHSVLSDSAGYAQHSGHADTALYVANGGFAAGSFTMPDGFKNVTSVVIDTSVNYPVPAGKNLYISSAETPVAIDGNSVYSDVRGYGANTRTFIGASENSIVWVSRSPIAGFLVDKRVEWKTINALAAPFTVPAGKQFVIVNTSAASGGISATTGGVDIRSNFPNQTCKITLNNAPCSIVSNMVLGPGDTISSAGCPPGSTTVYYTVNGYLMDR